MGDYYIISAKHIVLYYSVLYVPRNDGLKFVFVEWVSIYVAPNASLFTYNRARQRSVMYCHGLQGTEARHTIYV